MRVLQLISSSGFFGAENMIVSLMKGLSSQKCDVVVASLLTHSNCSGDLTLRARQCGFESCAIPCGRKFDPRSISKLRSIAIDGNYDVIHSHGYKADLYSWLAINEKKHVKIATVHNWPSKTLKMQAYASLDKLVLRSFAKVVAVSNNVARELNRSGVPLNKIVVINNGVDPAAFLNSTDRIRVQLKLQDFFVIGYVGRLAPEKGLDVLLSSVPGIVRHCPNAHVILVGEGPLRVQLTELAQTLRIESRVKFLGIRSDMADIYRAMDVLVLPSRDEGFPMTILEALAAGKAVVATSVGQISQLICDHETGLLIQPGSREQLIDAIVELFRSPELMNKVGQQGKHLVTRQFTAEAMAIKYLEQYRLLVQ
jgi:glycosyltransferase involved in cell wall biosynthesis